MKKFFRSEQFPIVVLLIVILMIGLFMLADYGESWDEPPIYDYAHYSFQAYQYILHPQDLQLFPTFSMNLNVYGPA